MPYLSAYDISTAGITPHEPAVGAATMHFIQALLSATAIAVYITFKAKSPSRVSPSEYFFNLALSPPTSPLADLSSASWLR